MIRPSFGFLKRPSLFLLALVFTSPMGLAEVRKLKLLNPDGSPATDAIAIAIMTAGTRVNESLHELPNLAQEMSSKNATVALENHGGIVQYDSKALGILAESKTFGFVFVPVRPETSVAKLRPWAKLKIDLSAFSPQALQGKQICVLWENCFAGTHRRPITYLEGNDPFGSEDPVPHFDWRFDSLVMWSLTQMAQQQLVVDVPPGEVTVIMSSELLDNAQSLTQDPLVRFRPLRTLAGKEASFSAPELGTIAGKLVEDAGLPDWDSSGDKRPMIVATSLLSQVEEDFAKLNAGPVTQTKLDQLAHRYASDAGIKFRYDFVAGGSERIHENNSFQLQDLPAGHYQLYLQLPTGERFPLKQRGDSEEKPVIVTVSGRSVSPEDVGEVERSNPPKQRDKPAEATLLDGDDPFAEYVQAAAQGSPVQTVPQKNESTYSPELAERHIREQLGSVVRQLDFQSNPLSNVMESLQADFRIPIRIHTLKLQEANVDPNSPVTIYLPQITLQSGLRHILSTVSDHLAFTIRDEVLLITTKEDAERDAAEDPLRLKQSALDDTKLLEKDIDDAFVENLRKTLQNGNDTAALRSALQFQLESVFDANQKARRAEFEQLRQLLKQSEDWVDARQSRRSEIIQKKMEELLRKIQKP